LHAEARRTQSKVFVIKNFSELCELGVSVVKLLHRKRGIAAAKRVVD
jgi:hypothetical protein